MDAEEDTSAEKGCEPAATGSECGTDRRHDWLAALLKQEERGAEMDVRQARPGHTIS